MTYEIVYGERSLDRLFAVASELDAPHLLDAVEEAMGRLADDPVHHGVRGVHCINCATETDSPARIRLSLRRRPRTSRPLQSPSAFQNEENQLA